MIHDRPTPEPASPGSIAAYLERAERRQRELEGRIRALESTIEEARRDPLADLVDTRTFLQRYEFTEHQLRRWIFYRKENGAGAWIHQHRPHEGIYIDLRAFHEWFLERYQRQVPQKPRRRALG